MNKILTLGAVACAFALPLSAAVLDNTLNGSAAASSRNEGNRTTDSSVGVDIHEKSAAKTERERDQRERDASVDANVDAGARVEGQRSVTPRADGTPATKEMHDEAVKDRSRATAGLRREYRSFSRRLDKVEDRIDQAEREGRYNAEQAAQHRHDVEEIRGSFKASADASAQSLSSADKAKLDAQVKAQEEAVAKKP